MKSQKGMGHLMLIICIVVIILFIIGIIYIAKTNVEEEILETYETNMLLIQGKVKIISQESTIQKKEELLKGRKLSDNLEDEQVKKLLENGIISQEETSFSKYYILEKSHLEEIGLGNIELKEGYYIVNYDTDEIIYSKGIIIGKETYYKLSELEEKNKQKENQEQVVNEIAE